MNIRTWARQTGVVERGGIVEGKGKSALVPPCISSPQLHTPGTALKPCSASSLPHPSPEAREATCQSPLMGHTLFHLWKVLSQSGLESSVLGQQSLSNSASHPFYLKQKASSVQSVMNYFFGFGLMTCVRKCWESQFHLQLGQGAVCFNPACFMY